MIPFCAAITVRDYVVFPDVALSVAGAHFLLLVRSWSKKWEATVDTPTSGSASSTARLNQGEQGSAGYLDPDALIIPIRKTDRNPFAQTVIVGRARNSDVVLESATVSKVHAYLLLSADDPSAVTVKDCRSTNGTFVLLGSGPKRLVDGEEFRAVGGVELRFGTVDCMVVEASGLAQAANYAMKSWPKDWGAQA